MCVDIEANNTLASRLRTWRKPQTSHQEATTKKFQSLIPNGRSSQEARPRNYEPNGLKSGGRVGTFLGILNIVA